ncbi:MAG: DUF1684 domain-containing protein [Pseudomonadota bacterium]
MRRLSVRDRVSVPARPSSDKARAQCHRPLRDKTSGGETYGGGRYLLDTIKGADLGHTKTGALILDFNFSYHPSCCHSPDWLCPLSPADNHVLCEIRAGEHLPPG